MNFIKLPGDELLSTSLDKDSVLILVDPTQEIINDIKQKYPDGLIIKRLEIYYGKDIDSEVDFGINGNKYPLNCFININKKTNNIKLKNIISESYKEEPTQPTQLTIAKDIDFGDKIKSWNVDKLKTEYSGFENCIFDIDLIQHEPVSQYINKNKFRIKFDDLINNHYKVLGESELDIHLIMSNKDFNKLILYGDFFYNKNTDFTRAKSLKIENELTGEIITNNHLETKGYDYYLKINFLPDYILNTLKDFYTAQTVMTTLDEVPYDKYNYEKDENFIREKGWIVNSTWKDEATKQSDLENLINRYKSKYTSQWDIERYGNDYSFSIIDKYNEIQAEYDKIASRLTNSPDPDTQKVLEDTKKFDLAKAKNKFYSIYKYKDIPDEVLNKLPLVDVKQEEMEILTKNGYQLKIGNYITDLKRYYNAKGWTDITGDEGIGVKNQASYELPQFFHYMFDAVKPKSIIPLTRNLCYDTANPNLEIDNKFIKKFFDSELNISIPTIKNLKIVNGGKYKVTADVINLEFLQGKTEIDITCSSLNVNCKGLYPLENYAPSNRESETNVKLTSNVDIENANIEKAHFSTSNNINNLYFINSRVYAGEIRNFNNSALTTTTKYDGRIEYETSFVEFTLTPSNIKQNFQDYGDAIDLKGKNYFELPAVDTYFSIKEENPIFDDLVLVFKNGATKIWDTSSYQNFNYFVDNTSFKNRTIGSEPIRIALSPWLRNIIFAYNIENYLTKDEYSVLFGDYDLENNYNYYIKRIKEIQEEFKNFKQKYIKIYQKNEAGNPIHTVEIGSFGFDKGYGKTIKKFVPLKVVGDEYNQQIIPLDDNLQLSENESFEIIGLNDISTTLEFEYSNFAPGCFTYNNVGEIESPFLEVKDRYSTEKYIGCIYEFNKNNVKSHIVKRVKNAFLHSIYFISPECTDSEIENVIIYGTPRDLRHLTDKKPLKNIGFWDSDSRVYSAENFSKENIFKFKDIDGLYPIHMYYRPTRHAFGCWCSLPTPVHAENCTFKFNDFESYNKSVVEFNYDIDKDKLIITPSDSHYVFTPFINLDISKIKSVTNDEQVCELLKDRSNRLPVKFVDNKTTKTFKNQLNWSYNNAYDVRPIIDTDGLDYWKPAYREKQKKYTELFKQKLNELRTLEGIEWSDTSDIWLFRKYVNSFDYTLNVGETEYGFQDINNRIVNTNPLKYLSNKCIECDDKNNIKITNFKELGRGYKHGETFVFNNKKFRIIK